VSAARQCICECALFGHKANELSGTCEHNYHTVGVEVLVAQCRINVHPLTRSGLGYRGKRNPTLVISGNQPGIWFDRIPGLRMFSILHPFPGKLKWADGSSLAHAGGSRTEVASDLEAGTAVERGPAEAAFRKMSAVHAEGDPLNVFMS
jgi:hypothetical protein